MSEPKEKSAKQLAYEAQQADLAIYEKRMEKSTHRALVAELKRQSNKGYEGKGFVMNGVDFSELNQGRKVRNRASIASAEAAVLKIVLENTRTAPVFEFKRDGTPLRYAKKHQIGPGTLSHFLR